MFQKAFIASTADLIRLEALFPEVLSEEGVHNDGGRAFVAEWDIEERIERALQARDFRSLPSAAYLNPRFSEGFYRRFEPVYQEFLEVLAVEDPGFIMSDVQKSFWRLHIPSQMMSDKVCRRVLSRVRLKTLDGLSDRRFVELFSDEHAMKAAAGYLGNADPTMPEAVEFAEAFHQRFRSLRR